jgi:hypothetical protein
MALAKAVVWLARRLSGGWAQGLAAEFFVASLNGHKTFKVAY